MSAGGKTAVVAEAVSAAAGELAARAADPEQATMFPLPTRFHGARAEAVQARQAARRGPGRPDGALNKATENWRKWLLARGKSPLQSLMEWSLHDPVTLAAELGCTRLEAMRVLVDVWGELAAFLHPKMVPTDADDKVPPFFAMTIGGQHVSFTGDRPPWSYLDGEAREVPENEGVSASTPAVSDAVASDGKPK